MLSLNKKFFIMPYFMVIMPLSMLGMGMRNYHPFLLRSATEATQGFASRKKSLLPDQLNLRAEINPGVLKQVQQESAMAKKPIWASSGSFKQTRPNLFRATASRLMSRKEAADLLGVSEYATKKEIKNAYRSKAKIAHPDMGGSDQAMKAVIDAKSVLDGSEDSTFDSQASSYSREEEERQHDINVVMQFQITYERILRDRRYPLENMTDQELFVEVLSLEENRLNPSYSNPTLRYCENRVLEIKQEQDRRERTKKEELQDQSFSENLGKMDISKLIAKDIDLSTYKKYTSVYANRRKMDIKNEIKSRPYAERLKFRVGRRTSKAKAAAVALGAAGTYSKAKAAAVALGAAGTYKVAKTRQVSQALVEADTKKQQLIDQDPRNHLENMTLDQLKEEKARTKDRSYFLKRSYIKNRLAEIKKEENKRYYSEKQKLYTPEDTAAYNAFKVN